MIKNRVLVDLSSLKDMYCGLGQVAMSYGKYFRENYSQSESPYHLTLLLPDNMIGKFGNEVAYISLSRKLTRRYQFLLPKFDVWHSINQLSRFIPRASKTKLILTVHDLNHLYERNGLRRLRKHMQIKRRVKRADRVVCISEFSKTELVKHLHVDSDKCKVIYNYVELLDKNLAEAPNVEINEPFFFSIGVILQKKNLHVLLDMMKLLPDKHLYIAGREHAIAAKNTYALNIKERITNENIHNVTLLGPIGHREKIWFYSHCEAFLFPSLFEGFGLPVIEAMQFGKAVFSSVETSLKEIGDRHSKFWYDFDPSKMKEVVMEGLANHGSEEQMREIAYAASFSTHKHFREYEEMYGKL